MKRLQRWAGGTFRGVAERVQVWERLHGIDRFFSDFPKGKRELCPATRRTSQLFRSIDRAARGVGAAPSVLENKSTATEASSDRRPELLWKPGLQTETESVQKHPAGLSFPPGPSGIFSSHEPVWAEEIGPDETSHDSDRRHVGGEPGRMLLLHPER
ncbi:hypothetical protein EYF80_064087 [Liparis tanakae]|uniref:Uncharacterized protein n=1 Tax=Liparis tanakae TaxID=230148 RepID=A0A4Z2EAK0_9TELE|nr:hypothetical protein EYF80_064087 [Liparis tanakae]